MIAIRIIPSSLSYEVLDSNKALLLLAESSNRSPLILELGMFQWAQ